MTCYYDFHIHSALSPCSDDDMTPNNIVGMAALKGLDAIAIADHNTVGNVRAAMAVGRQLGVTVVPGMEVESAEEVHVLTLFPTIEAAEQAALVVRQALPDMPNKPDLFGNQLLLDEHDRVVGTEERMLITACGLPLYEVFALVRSVGGVAIPAHVDRHSYSVLSNLGFVPPDLSISFLELSTRVDDPVRYLRNRKLESYRVLCNSDAHHLGDISEKTNAIDILSNTAGDIVKGL